MNRFDFTIIHFLNAFAHRSPACDALISLIEESNLVKGGVSLAIFWWAWFRYDEPSSSRREFLLFAFVSSAFALLLGRACALWIPFRERPFQNPAYHFQLPYEVTGSVHSWNSAPSDHAVLFFCLATSLWMVSWRLGVLGMCHALFVVCLPRIYVGYHYPTDLLAGALIGTAVAFICKWPWLRKEVTQPVFRWMEKYPAAFYALAFIWTFEVAELFETLLKFQSFLRHSLRLFL